MNKGWFCFHRAHLDLPIGSSLELVGAWAIVQAAAAHEPQEFFLGFQKIALKKGEFIFGEKKFGEKMRCSPSKARRILKILESEELISCEPTPRFTLVKVNNYETLQSKLFESEEQKKCKKSAKKVEKKTYNNSEQLKQSDQDLMENKNFLTFFKWVRGMPEHVRNPENYARTIFAKYPENVIRLALRDDTTTSLRKFGKNIDLYLAKERKRADNFTNS
jgi:hypothetical protein